jgi:perosamine synthetase
MRMIARYRPTFTYRDLAQSLRSSRGADVDQLLKSRLSSLYDTKHIFLTRSARVGLSLILKAHGRPGGVLLPAYNCIVVPEAIHFAGCAPVFVDIDDSSLNVTAERLEDAMNPGISVVLATHLFGIPCDLDTIVPRMRRYGVLIVEDAAAALGGEYDHRLLGTFADAAVISFQSTKVISAEAGGAILTNDDGLAKKIGRIFDGVACGQSYLPFLRLAARKALFHPTVYPMAQFVRRLLKGEQMYEIVGPARKEPPSYCRGCSSYDEALVLAQIDRLGANLRRRRHAADLYQAAVDDHPHLKVPKIPEQSSPAWIQFPVLCEDKVRFYRYMRKNHIDLSWTYRYSCAESYGRHGFPNALRAAKTVVGLPTYPGLSESEIERICSAAGRYSKTSSS